VAVRSDDRARPEEAGVRGVRRPAQRGHLRPCRVPLDSHSARAFDRGNGEGRTAIPRATDAWKLRAATALGGCLLLVTSGAAFPPHSGAGALDVSFGVDGRVTTQIGPANDTADAVAVQRDGRIVVAGSSYNGADYDFAVVRYRPDGALDRTFGSGGIVTTDIAGTDDEVRAIAVQPDGKIVVAGYAAERGYTGVNVEPDDESAWALVRYTRDGRLDPTFGTGGKVTSAPRPWLNGAYGLAVQRDGRIVVSGFSSNAVDLDFALARYHADGSLDSTFGNGGFVISAFSHGNEIANGLALQRDGKILVAGPSSPGDVYEVAVARYLPTGALDRTFGRRGVAWASNGRGSDEALAVAVQPDGKPVAAGWSYDANGYDFGVTRFRANGAPDPAFGHDGRATTAIGTGEDMGLAVAVQPGGKIVVAGHSANPSDWDFSLAEYLPNGRLDRTFGSDGTVLTDFSAGDGARAVAVQPDGKIVVAGYAANGRVFAVARYLAG
jgi:uncharacterized delta-60 repeat protein